MTWQYRSRSKEPRPHSSEYPDAGIKQHHNVVSLAEDVTDPNTDPRRTVSRRSSATGRVGSRVGKKKDEDSSKKASTRARSGTTSLQMLRDSRQEVTGELCERSANSAVSQRRCESHKARKEHTMRRRSIGAKVNNLDLLSTNPHARHEKKPMLKPKSDTKWKESFNKLFDADFQFPPAEEHATAEPTLRTRGRLSVVDTCDLKQPKRHGYGTGNCGSYPTRPPGHLS